MPDLYEGQTDARQAQEPIVPSRFRPRYRPLSEREKALHDAIKAKAAELEELFEQIPVVRNLAADREGVRINPSYLGRDGALAMTHLEDAVMRAVRALTA